MKAAASIALLVTVASCGTTVVYTPAARATALSETHAPARVDVYDKSAPTRPSVVIGTLATEPDTIYVDTQLTGELVAEMQRVAARAGCNALVMDGSTPAPDARFGGRAFATVSYHASCLVYTDAQVR